MHPPSLLPNTIEPNVVDVIVTLPCWTGPLEIAPLLGGMTNRNYRVRDAVGSYAVRLGHDVPEHGIMRLNEHTVARAAFAAGVAPEVVFSNNGVLVTRLIHGKTLTAHDIANPLQLPRVLDVVQCFHQQTHHHLRGPVVTFSVNQVITHYLKTLEKSSNNPLKPYMARLIKLAQSLEAVALPIEIVVGHNDLLAANFLDDGQRLWLIDFEYAGWNTPLFDLANLSNNNNFTPEQDDWMLHHYFGSVTAPSQRMAFTNMKQAALLRDVLWCGVSQSTHLLGLDHTQYIEHCLQGLQVV